MTANGRDVRLRFFDSVEKLHPLTGYDERSIHWFNQCVLPDLLLTKNRLNLGQALLDVGCAYGYFTDIMAGHFTSVKGIDFSPARIAGARIYHQASNVEYHVSDLVTGRLSDISAVFDGVVSLAVIQHISPEDRRKVFENVASILARGSFFVLYDERFEDRPHSWDGFYEPLSGEWLRANVGDLFELTACEFVCRAANGEPEYRYELKRK